MSAQSFVSLYAEYADIHEKQTHDTAINIMVDIHIDSFHAYYAVYLEDNRWVFCFLSQPVPTIMDSFAPEVTVEFFAQ